MATKSNEDQINERISFILKNLSWENKDRFLSEIMSMALSGKGKEIADCILDWEETAEVNSVPGKRKRLLSRCKSLNKVLSIKRNG